MAEHVLAAVRVPEGYVAELDIAADRLPVLALRLEGRAVLLDHLGRVRDERLLLEQAHHALNIRLQGKNVRDVAGNLLDRLEDADGVRRKRGQRADQHQILEHKRAAARQHNRRRQRAEKHHKRNVHRAEPRRLHRGNAHILRDLLEFAAILILNDKRFRRARAHDALVVRARDPRIHLAHAAVPAQDAVLKPRREQRNHRHNQNDRRREARIEQEHRPEHAEHVEDRPQNIDRVPRNHARDPVGVAHDAGKQIPHRRDIIIGKRERLQMHKARPLHVAPHLHFNAHGAPRKQDYRQRLHADHARIQRGKARQSGGVPRLDKLVDRIPLKQRQRNVDAGAHHIEREHDKNQLTVRL